MREASFRAVDARAFRFSSRATGIFRKKRVLNRLCADRTLITPGTQDGGKPARHGNLSRIRNSYILARTAAM